MKTGIIYIATNKINGKSYIGQTIKSLEYRIRRHITTSKTRNTHFANALKKYGSNNWEWKILYKNIPIYKLNIAEICSIYIYDTYYTGYNSTLGGDINPTQNPETRIKISKSRMGIKLPAFTEEHKKRISESNFGKRHTYETRKRLSSAHKGKKLTEKHKENISLSGRGKCKTKYHISKIAYLNSMIWKIIKPDGNIEIIKNLNEYCRSNNLIQGHMSAVAKGERSHHKGYKVVKIKL